MTTFFVPSFVRLCVSFFAEDARTFLPLSGLRTLLKLRNRRGEVDKVQAQWPSIEVRCTLVSRTMRLARSTDDVKIVHDHQSEIRNEQLSSYYLINALSTMCQREKRKVSIQHESFDSLLFSFPFVFIAIVDTLLLLRTHNVHSRPDYWLAHSDSSERM